VDDVSRSRPRGKVGSPRRTPTQRDVAERAGVSVATVSYVLSGRPNRRSGVPEPTRSRVLDAMRELGYRPNRAGRVLRRRRTELIALVWRPPLSSWIDQFSNQAEDVAAQHGYAIVHLPVRDDARAERVARMLGEGMVDGAMLLGRCGIAPESLMSLAGDGLAIMVIADELAPSGYDVVWHGERGAMRLAVDHLHDRGYRRIAVLGPTAEKLPESLRALGSLEALDAAGLPIEVGTAGSLYAGAGDYREAMYDAALELLRRPDRPDAVLSMTDRGAIATMWAAREVGLDVPGDLAVMGVGNTTEGEMAKPQLTTIGSTDRDFTQLVARLFARIADPDMTGTLFRREWELIVRDST
jgi:LacI family transcriptional regulator